MSQEIETTLDESSVTAGAKPADPMPNWALTVVVSLVCKTSVVQHPKTANPLMIAISIRLLLVVMPLLQQLNPLTPLALKQNLLLRVM